MNKINIEEIKQKMFNKLEDSGWQRVFKSYIFSSDFEDSIKKLHTFVSQDKRFTPPLKDIFRAFEECPYKDLKVVMIGQDPYSQLGVADGIAFSCSKTDDSHNHHLHYMFKEIRSTVSSIYPLRNDLG